VMSLLLYHYSDPLKNFAIYALLPFIPFVAYGVYNGEDTSGLILSL